MQQPACVYERDWIMAEKRDYYEVLGVSRDADDAALKSAYRALAKKYHPDTNPGNAEAAEKFKEASEAYSVLSDPQKRQQYDQFGHAAFGGGADGAEDSAASAVLISMAQIWATCSAIFSAICSAAAEAAEPTTAPCSGANVRASVRITFDEAVKGCEKELTLNLKEECKTCHGTGCKAGNQPADLSEMRRQGTGGLYPAVHVSAW